MTILDDSFYRECIQLATNSKSKKMRFGSIVVKDGEIIGRGWNRRPVGGPISMGYANHAEAESINDVLNNGRKTDGSQLLVAGYFAEDGSLYMPRKLCYTCRACPDYFEKYEISEVLVPLVSGWGRLSVEEAGKSARSSSISSYARRISVGRSGLKVDNVLS